MLKKNRHILPVPPRLRALIGPSFILLGLGLGSGEIILWPYLAANWGLGIVWGAVLGITFQYFINMEIERYSLARGESVFVGLGRRWGWAPYWLIISTLIGFGWPGIIASSAFLFAAVVPGVASTAIAIGLLVLIGVILTAGSSIYKTVERFSQIIILIGVPAIIALTVWLANQADWSALAAGVVGRGDGYWFLPAGIPLASFLAAFAFSGAGGNLNLTQSSYIREKGYGMGFFMAKMKGLFSGKSERIDLNGYEFQPTAQNVTLFKAWWKQVNREHALVFYATGLVTILLLLLLSFSTTFGLPNNATGIRFVVNEAGAIGERTLPIIGTIFTLVAGLMLFSTQLTVMDSTSRIMSENLAVVYMKKNQRVNLSRFYYIFLWVQIVFGIVVFSVGLKEPLTLLVLAAAINAVCMFVHIGLVNVLNYRELPAEIRPALFRRVMIGIAFVFFGFFCALTIWSTWFK